MLPTLLIDGNNLGHVLGLIDKATGTYDTIGLLNRLDQVARFLATQGQETKIILFLDDATAAERLSGWHVDVAPVPEGDADAAIRTYAQAHAHHPLTLVSADQALCGDAAMWGAVCLSPEAFISRYLVAARQTGSSRYQATTKNDSDFRQYLIENGDKTDLTGQASSSESYADQGQADRKLQTAALERTRATLRGEPLPVPEIYRLNLDKWKDPAELALYLLEHHLCSAHHDLTDPEEMILAIRQHCSQQPRYFTSGRIINRVFRLFLCRPEHSLSLNDLVQLAQTRRRKIRAAIEKYGEQLGIEVAW
jgi:hypothetical protein